MLIKVKAKLEFSRNVLTLMTGRTIAILIAISPILTSIYTSKDFVGIKLNASKDL